VKKVKMISAALIIVLSTVIFGMSGDGGNVPVVQKKGAVKDNQQVNLQEVVGLEEKDNNPSPGLLQRDEKYPIKTIQTKKGNFSYCRATNGDYWAVEGGTLIFADRIIKDSNGNEIVLDKYKHNTGLSVEEYIQHKVDYQYRIDEILAQKGISKDSVFGSVDMWYKSRINLDKLEELKQNGFDALPKGGHGIGGGSLSSICIGSDALVIGEVVSSDSIDFNATRFNYKLRIKIDEVYSSSKEVESSSMVECLYLYNSGKVKIPFNQQVVIALINPLGTDYAKTGLLMVATWFEIKDGKVTHNKNMKGEKKTMPLVDFRKQVKELLRINDADNFYKKSWKEAIK